MLIPIFRNALLAIALVCGATTASYAADPTLHDVFAAVQAGRLADADAMMNEVIKAHPDSAKAHYVHAEVLAREGRSAEARDALATAEKLSPGLSFAKPSAVAHLRELVNGGGAAQRVANGGVPGGHFSLTPILVAVGGLFLVMFIVRAISARRRAAAGYYPGAYGGGVQGGPYGGGPMGGPAPMGGSSGPGIGSSIVSGLAMGAGLAAGESLVHRMMDGNRAEGIGGYEPGGLTNASRNVPEDQDFGVSDGGSWDDSSGFVDGSDLGSGDIGGDDWS